MLALGRALARRPRLLLHDGLSLGLAPVIVEELLPVVRRFADGSGCDGGGQRARSRRHLRCAVVRAPGGGSGR